MALDRIVSLVLRVAELVFAAIVVGVNGEHLHKSRASTSSEARFIYTEVVAALSLFLAIIWLVPFSSTFTHWPVDIFISLCWWAAFGILVDLLGDSCGAVFQWNNVRPMGDACGKFKTIVAFAFLSALLWLVSALIGLFWVRKHERLAARADAVHNRRHRWYRRSRV